MQIAVKYVPTRKNPLNRLYERLRGFVNDHRVGLDNLFIGFLIVSTLTIGYIVFFRADLIIAGF